MELPAFYKSAVASDNGDLRSLHLRLYECFQAVWSCVKDTLCNDTPAGHVPSEVDDDADLGTNDVLSYSWRALKEARYIQD